jgi:2-keto-4-pentenoate hydratase/2-oxohepta-3-ene-1,7-dioic acid hydratase in catechol pathway
MRFLSFRHGGQPTWGAETDGVIRDLGVSGAALAPTLRQAIADSVVPSNPERIASAPVIDPSAIEFLPVIPDPAKVLCVGLNYRSHREEAKPSEMQYPVLFTRFADSQIGHGQPTLMPHRSTAFDYEGEVAVIVGTRLHLADPDTAAKAVAGYACYNDFSEREWQRHTAQWTPGKNFPATGAFGPYLVPAADLPDLGSLELETRVNGEIRQSAKLSDLIFDVPALLSYISAFTPLSPGDVVVTGTPGGVGLFMEPQTFLRPGDTVEVEVTELGTLHNMVQAAE